MAKNEVDSVEFTSPTLHFGIPVDSLDITEGRIKRNQNLSEILVKFNIPYQDIHTLSHRSKDVYDVRKLKAGSSYWILHKRDSFKTAKHFIVEPSPKEYVIYNVTDSIFAELHRRPLEIRKRVLATEIKSSLYNTILDQNTSPLLVSRLEKMFAWQVDFFRISEGDQFKIIFEEELIEGEIVGIRNIMGAYFEHWGKFYYAIPFDTGEKQEFFDEEGNNLIKPFLRAPLNYSRISSRYSLRRFHPVQKRYKPHLGTDYAAPTGTPIRTVGDGVVLEARYSRGNGNYVKIKHNSQYITQYLHMSKIARGIRPGKKVRQGRTIGYVGSTGLANGPHLCFRFWKNGRQVDALKLDLPPSTSIDLSQKAAFKVVRDSIKAQLDAIKFEGNQKLMAKFSDNVWLSDDIRLLIEE